MQMHGDTIDLLSTYAIVPNETHPKQSLEKYIYFSHCIVNIKGQVVND